jgi:hypothetical protein
MAIVHGKCTAALARVTAIILGLIVAAVVVLTDTGIHAKVVMDQVNIQLKPMRQ